MATILRFPIRPAAEAEAATRADLERLAALRQEAAAATRAATRADFYERLASHSAALEELAWEYAREGYSGASKSLTNAMVGLRAEQWNFFDTEHDDHSPEAARRRAAVEIRRAREYVRRVKASVQRYHGYHGNYPRSPVFRGRASCAKCKEVRNGRALREELRNRAAAAGVPLADYVTDALWRAARPVDDIKIDGQTLERVRAAAARAGKAVDEWVTNALRRAAALGLARLVRKPWRERINADRKGGGDGDDSTVSDSDDGGGSGGAGRP